MTSPPTLVVLSTDPTPPYEQLRRQLAEMIGSRLLAPGTRLPPVRQLAGDLGLAVGTVARAYRELEAAGIVESRRGGGTRVVDHAPRISAGERGRLLARHVENLVHEARLLGADPAEVLAVVQAALDRNGPTSAAAARTALSGRRGESG